MHRSGSVSTQSVPTRGHQRPTSKWVVGNAGGRKLSTHGAIVRLYQQRCPSAAQIVRRLRVLVGRPVRPVVAAVAVAAMAASVAAVAILVPPMLTAVVAAVAAVAAAAVTAATRGAMRLVWRCCWWCSAACTICRATPANHRLRSRRSANRTIRQLHARPASCASHGQLPRAPTAP